MTMPRRNGASSLRTAKAAAAARTSRIATLKRRRSAAEIAGKEEVVTDDFGPPCSPFATICGLQLAQALVFIDREQ